jgi:prevent-host-death family protein
MNEIALFDAKNRLSELVARVEGGEEFVITRRGKPIARLVRNEEKSAQGAAKMAIAALKRNREGVSLGRLKSRDLIQTGRR